MWWFLRNLVNRTTDFINPAKIRIRNFWFILPPPFFYTHMIHARYLLMIVYFHFIDSMLIFSLDSSRPRWTMFRLGVFRINNLKVSTISRDSSVGRASDWRSEGPWFNAGELNWALNYPGSRQFLFFKCTINASSFKNIFWTSYWVFMYLLCRKT